MVQAAAGVSGNDTGDLSRVVPLYLPDNVLKFGRVQYGGNSTVDSFAGLLAELNALSERAGGGNASAPLP